jgi:hypothetical protein
MDDPEKMARTNFMRHSRPQALKLEGGGGGGGGGGCCEAGSGQVFKMFFGKTCNDELCPVYRSCLLPYTIIL